MCCVTEAESNWLESGFFGLREAFGSMARIRTCQSCTSGESYLALAGIRTRPG